MIPEFELPAGYASRKMRFVLAKVRNGWKFYGECAGYLVPALSPHRKPCGRVHLCDNTTFSTKAEAARMANILSLPTYAEWNGRKRAYVGKAAMFMVHARTENPSSELIAGGAV